MLSDCGLRIADCGLAERNHFVLVLVLVLEFLKC